MAYIAACEVIGLAAQLNRGFNLKRGTNVFFGGNGSGKTSLLKVLHSALKNDLTELKGIALEAAKVVISDVNENEDNSLYSYQHQTVRQTPADFRNPKQTTKTLLTRMREDSEGGKWLSHLSLSGVAALSSTSDRPIQHIFLPITRLYERVAPRDNSLGWASAPGTDFDKDFEDTINFLWLQYTRNLGIEVQIEQGRGLRQILYDLLIPNNDDGGYFKPIPDPHSAYTRVMAFLNQQSYLDWSALDEEQFVKQMDDPRLRTVIENVERVEEKVNALTSPRAELIRVLRRMIGGGKQIHIEDKDIRALGRKEEEIRLRSLSSGEKQLLRIFIDVLLADGSPIIIDEPELSLHIDWQRRLLGILRNLAPKSQIIVATHSPEIMSEISEENIIELG